MNVPMFHLYSYFRSSCAYRVRIALALKNLPFQIHPIHLLEQGGQQYSEEYLQQNPMGEIPSLALFDEEGKHIGTIGQSIAILEYIEEIAPHPPLLPPSAYDRAKVRQIVESVNSSIHPVQNLKVMKRLCHEFSIDMPQARQCGKYWIEKGFQGIESILKKTAGEHAYHDQLSFADLVLVPQHYNALRFEVDMRSFPTIQNVCERALTLDAFQQASPEQQLDAS